MHTLTYDRLINKIIVADDGAVRLLARLQKSVQKGQGFLVMTKKPTIKKSHMLPWEDADDYETLVGRRGQGSALRGEARERQFIHSVPL